MKSNSKKSTPKTAFEKEQAKALRHEGHLQRLGVPNPACVVCGYSKPEGLTNKAHVLEEHHLEGNHEGLTVAVCLNHHAELSDKQKDWDSRLQEKNRTPLVRLASCLQGLGEFLIAIGQIILGWVAWLLGLNERIPSDVMEGLPLPEEIK